MDALSREEARKNYETFLAQVGKLVQMIRMRDTVHSCQLAEQYIDECEIFKMIHDFHDPPWADPAVAYGVMLCLAHVASAASENYVLLHPRIAAVSQHDLL